MADFPFDVVGFDLDGTLLDTADDLGHALNHTLALIGRPIIPLPEVRGLIGGGTAQMLRGGLARTGGIDEAMMSDLTERLGEFYADNIARHTVFYPGAETMLDDLQARGVRIAVATNKREALARRLFDELGLTPRALAKALLPGLETALGETVDCFVCLQPIDFGSDAVRFLTCCEGGSFACGECVRGHPHPPQAEWQIVRQTASIRKSLGL